VDAMQANFMPEYLEEIAKLEQNPEAFSESN